jgi:hypothetical protein
MIVYLVWADSSHLDKAGWTSAEEWLKYAEECHCHSVGKVIFEDKKTIVLAPHWYDYREGELDILGGLRIPISAIRLREILKEDKNNNDDGQDNEQRSSDSARAKWKRRKAREGLPEPH